MKNKLLIIALFLCSACQTVTETKIDLPDPPLLKMRPIEWKVLSDGENAYMCLAPDSYSNLSLNTQDLKTFIIYQNKLIKIYKYNY